MKALKIILIVTTVFCCIGCFAQDESNFEKYIKEVCAKTYDTNLYDEQTGDVLWKNNAPRLFLYEHERDSISHLLSDKNNNNIFYQNIMLRHDTTGNKELQKFFFNVMWVIFLIVKGRSKTYIRI